MLKNTLSISGGKRSSGRASALLFADIRLSCSLDSRWINCYPLWDRDTVGVPPAADTNEFDQSPYQRCAMGPTTNLQYSTSNNFINIDLFQSMNKIIE